MAPASPSGRADWLDKTGPIAAWGPVAPFLAIAAQLAALLTLLRLFEIEPGTGLPRILPLIFVGFLIHAALPIRHRMLFFLLLSVVAIGLIMGPVGGAVLVSVGLLLIGVCHLPLAFPARVLILILIAAVMAAVRMGWPAEAFAAPWAFPGLSKSVLPVLASMFMFRLIIYLYDLRHEERARATGTPLKGVAGQATPVWARLSYFFLLPNVCFLLFPIIDYRTFRRTYYDTNAHAIYQKGIWWICLGLIQLLLYRLVYHYLVPAPEDVQGLGGIVRFMLSAYLIYLRVVGQFQLIVGLLCLFGFNLPPAHNFYLLSSSFTNFWRRSRIEWKDFMVKVFYYPALVPLQRKLGATPALIVTTVWVFLVTWLLHSYQWFWFTGAFRLLANDGVFWTLIGGCVLVNSLLEARKAPARPSSRWNTGRALLQATKVVGMFAFMCVLWSYWSSASLGDWLSYLTAAKESGPAAYAWLVGVLLAVVSGGTLAQYIAFRRVASAKPAAAGKPRVSVQPVSWTPLSWRPVMVAVAAAMLFLIRIPTASTAMAGPLVSVVSTLSTTRLNAMDQEREDRGYYEELLDVPRSSVAVATSVGAMAEASKGSVPAPDTSAAADAIGVRNGRGDGAAEPKSAADGPDGAITRDVVGRRLRPYERMTDDMTMWENAPGFVGSFKDAPVITNRWGMRDKEYPLEPTPGTFRMALLGSSMTVGAGVPVEQTMETLLEDRLNREAPGVPSRRYEILNFSVGAYGIMQNAALMDLKVSRFKPDAVLVGVFSVDAGRNSNYLMKLVRSGIPIQFPYVRDKLQAAGVTEDMQRPELLRRLNSVSEDLVRWSYQHIVDVCRERGIVVLGIVLPEPMPKAGHDIDQSARLAKAAGLPLLDLRGVYGSEPPERFKLGGAEEPDPHWNSRGHKLISDRIYRLLRENDARALKLGFNKKKTAVVTPPESAGGPSARARPWRLMPVERRVMPVARSRARAIGGSRRARSADRLGAFERSQQLKGPWLRMTGDVLEFEHRPSFTISYQGQFPFATNAWGMRDKEYPLAAAPGTFRIALLGSSVETGAGVPVEQNYESRLEARLNREGPKAPMRRYEILNFAVGSYSILQNMVVMERKVLPFSPNAIMLAVHSMEPQPTTRLLISHIQSETPIPYPFLQAKLREVGVQPHMGVPELRRRLQPVMDDIVRWGYQRIAEIASQRGLPVIAVLVPRSDLPPTEAKVLAKQARFAAEFGMRVLSLEGTFTAGDSVRLPPPNNHPNARGHQLLADRLFQELRVKDAQALNIGFGR